MTSTSPAISAWASRPIGKAARVAIALGGMAIATLVLMTAAVVSSGSWALVLLGVAFAALSVRTALVPTATRFVLFSIAAIAIPLSLQII